MRWWRLRTLRSSGWTITSTMRLRTLKPQHRSKSTWPFLSNPGLLDAHPQVQTQLNTSNKNSNKSWWTAARQAPPTATVVAMMEMSSIHSNQEISSKWYPLEPLQTNNITLSATTHRATCCSMPSGQSITHQVIWQRVDFSRAHRWSAHRSSWWRRLRHLPSVTL